MKLNASKTKTMIFNHGGDSYPSTIVNLDSKSIDNVKRFQYLGCYIQYNQATTGDEELNLRIDSAESKFYAMGKKFMNHRINLKIRTSMLNSLVRSRLTYACQTWSLTKQQIDKVDSTYMGMIRRMIRNGFKRKADTYAFVHSNQKLLLMSGTILPSEFVKKIQRSFVAHIVRRNDHTILKRMLFNDDVKTIPGRQTSLWNNVLNSANEDESTFLKKAIDKVY